MKYLKKINSLSCCRRLASPICEPIFVLGIWTHFLHADYYGSFTRISDGVRCQFQRHFSVLRRPVNKFLGILAAYTVRRWSVIARIFQLLSKGK